MNANHAETWIKIGLNITYYRRKKGLTQAALAEACNISRNYMQTIERGHPAAVNVLIDVAETLEIPLMKLFEFRD